VDRRKFLHATTAAAVAGAAAGCTAVNTSFRSLSLEEAGALQALCGWIIPEDTAPGARQAGVVRYIDRQLAGKFREHREIYRAGLAAAIRLAGGDYSAAPPERQLAILRQMEKAPDTRRFVDLLVTHSMQGFYGNPRHGGNRDFASWRMLGIPPVPVRGRNPYDFSKGGPRAEG
jgi:gluconate 2-dehydrogenase gamma chain